MKLVGVSVLVVVVCMLNAEEAMENVTSFDSVDTDKNDAIDFNEFEKWHKSTLGVTSDEEIKNRFAKYDLSLDQVLDVSEFVPLAYEISRKPIDATEQIFKRMDLNNDRTVDASEVAIAKKEYDSGIIDSVLAVADVNNDGVLTFEEFSAQLNYNKPKNEKNTSKEMAHQMLNYIDSNQDEKLSAQEIHAFASAYNKLTEAEIAQVLTGLDANGDGFLTIDELERIPSQITELAHIQPPPAV
ncbi:hypothetical protein KIN20_037018 [Parelaphostrongylus tenuis]|uniref:EF-hand domain-containing protein n=1 Tax=Parelaphostrongylus tenuis TaxID=148309 RepID=A0AAD5WL00_PARTN|nr:hypothetical protein KIN20_037018 [Parelaphostrongylus tenuis]